MKHDDDEGMYEELERRALFDLPDEDEGGESPPDIVGALRGDVADGTEDLTLGGYVAKHDRVPAFEGSDGQPYTVDIDTEQVEDAGNTFAAFFIFIRWAATGAGIMDHLESGDVAHGSSEEDARRAALDLTLYEIRAELDAAIARRNEALEE